jgi:hypothetical protein
MQFVKCSLCGQKELPSVWVLVRSRDTRVELGTRCANRLRFDGQHETKALAHEIHEH